MGIGISCYLKNGLSFLFASSVVIFLMGVM